MTACRALREEAEWFYSQLSSPLGGISEGKAWAQVQLAPDEYLHTNGTIIGIVQHIAVCKLMYGSTAFRETEVRWRDCIGRLEAIGTSWEASLAYLAEAQQYWLSSWAALTDEDLDREFLHFRGVKWPGWKVITMVNHHDSYHSGQINLLASVVTSTSTPPDLCLDDERKAVIDLPGW